MSRLLSWNKLHLHQAWDTPCAKGPVHDYLVEYGIGQGTKDIIDGRFDPNAAENLPEVNTWLRHHIRQ
eukprot:5449628-Ditylum_brightwellii.AAC.1